MRRRPVPFVVLVAVLVASLLPALAAAAQSNKHNLGDVPPACTTPQMVQPNGQFPTSYGVPGCLHPNNSGIQINGAVVTDESTGLRRLQVDVTPGSVTVNGQDYPVTTVYLSNLLGNHATCIHWGAGDPLFECEPNLKNVYPDGTSGGGDAVSPCAGDACKVVFIPILPQPHWFRLTALGVAPGAGSYSYHAAASIIVYVDPASVGLPLPVPRYSPTGTPGEWQLDGTASVPGGSPITAWQWTLPNGSKLSGSIVNVSFPQAALPATVSLEVTDSQGQKASTSMTIKNGIFLSQLVKSPQNPQVGDTDAIATIHIDNIGAWPLTDVTATLGSAAPEIVRVGGGPVPASIALAPGASGTVTFKLDPKSAGTTTLHTAVSGTDGVNLLTDGPKPGDITIGNPGIKVEITTHKPSEREEFQGTLTITNPSTTPITDIVWADAAGIKIEAAPPAAGAPIPAQPSVVRDSGPDGALPTSLGPQQVIGLAYAFSAPTAGFSVLTAKATGKLPDQTVVSGTQALTVEVSNRPVSAQERITIGTKYLDKAIAEGVRQTGLFEEALAAELRTLLINQPEPTFAQTVWGAWLGAADVMNTLRYGPGFARQLRAYNEGFGETLAAKLPSIPWETLRDPGKRWAAAGRLADLAMAAPAKGLDYAGGAFQSLVDATGDDPGTVYALLPLANEMIATAAVTATSQGLSKLGGVVAKYPSDPEGAMHDGGAIVANVAAFVAEQALINAFGAKAGQMIAKLAKLASGAGPELAAAEITIVNTIGIEGAAADDVMSSRVARFAESNLVLADLEEGSIGIDQLAERAGFPLDRLLGTKEAIKDAEALAGKPLMYGARTSEPMAIPHYKPGAATPATPKQEWMPNKTLNPADLALGAHEEAGGLVGVYKPIKPTDAELAALEAVRPTSSATLTARFKKKLAEWEAWIDDAESDLRRIAAASAERDKDGLLKYPNGVTVLLDRGTSQLRPLIELPSKKTIRAVFLEEIPEAERAAYANWPNTDRVRLSSHAVGDPASPTITFRNDLTGRWFSSDFDGQFLVPGDGVKPANWSQVILTFQNSLRKYTGAVAAHGISDNAYDVGALVYPKAASFTLNSVRLAEREATAEIIAKNTRASAGDALARNSRYLARIQAEAFLAGEPLPGFGFFTPDEVKKLQHFAEITAAELLKDVDALPERVIRFFQGDIRIGYGAGPS